MKNRLSFLILFFIPMLAIAQGKGDQTFASFVYRSFDERGWTECRGLDNGNHITVVNEKGKQVAMLCYWFPQLEETSCRFSDDDMKMIRNSNADYILIGYGQTASNPMACFLLVASKVKKEMGLNRLWKYKLEIPVSDLRF
jgi:hypothetical protein